MGAFVRGYDTGQFFAREDAKETAASRPRVDRFIRQAEAAKLAGIGRTSLWKLERAGNFPKRVKPLGANSRAVRYRLSEVIAWQRRQQAGREP